MNVYSNDFKNKFFKFLQYKGTVEARQTVIRFAFGNMNCI